MEVVVAKLEGDGAREQRFVPELRGHARHEEREDALETRRVAFVA